MRKFTIKEAAKVMGVAPSTIRYYDKEGLLPFIEKNENGVRIFKESDFEWMAHITCMKKAGASIAVIKRYTKLCMEGDKTLKERLEIILKRRETVLKQMEELNKLMETIDHKIWYYETAIEAGTESIHEEKCYNLEELLNE